MLSRCVCALALTAAMIVAPAAPAQAAPDDVGIVTSDGVNLRGKWYAGPKGNQSPVALLLPRYNTDFAKGNWGALAEALQKKDFAVLMIDFRGQGGSTTILDQQVFAAQPQNRRYGAAQRFPKVVSGDYQPYLANDLVAARNFIDKKNDASQCNSSNLYVIADQESGAVAAMWATYEWLREARYRAPLEQPVQRRAGADIAAIICLSYRPALGVRPTSTWVRNTQNKLREVPFLFLHGAEATADLANARNLVSVLDPSGRAYQGGLNMTDRTYVAAVLKTKLAGIALFAPETKQTQEFIEKYIDVIRQRRGAETWENRDANKMVLAPVVPERITAPQPNARP